MNIKATEDKCNEIISKIVYKMVIFATHFSTMCIANVIITDAIKLCKNKGSKFWEIQDRIANSKSS